MNDPYETFAGDYDEFGAIDEYLGDERQFFADLFAQHNTQTALDCACGTGQHLYMLSELGCQVWGSDYSQAMLDVASVNLTERGKRIPLCRCDFRYLEREYTQTFDAVVCLTNALPHLHEDEDLLRAARSIRGRLNPGGVAVFTSGTTQYTLSLPPVEVVIEREDFTRVFVKERVENRHIIRILDLFHTPERLEHKEHVIEYRILSDDDYRRLLREAGFGTVRIYGDYACGPYTEKSRRLIVVAENG